MGGKATRAAVRVAGVLHCVDHPSEPWAEKISIETMTTALDLAAIFASHAEIAFNVMGCDQAIDGARKLWKWVERGRFPSFAKRDCFNDLRGRFPKVSDLEPCLEVLMERNYLSCLTKKTGGRPSVVFNVNPALTERWS